MAESIQNLRIYTTARALEDQVYELVKQLPADRYYPLGNDLRRASAAICHYLNEMHGVYSHSLKIDGLVQARLAAERTQSLLESAQRLIDCRTLRADYTAVIKQTWGFIRYLKLKRAEQGRRSEINAKDELVLARR